MHIEKQLNYVSAATGNALLVWFRNSGSFVFFKFPADFIFQKWKLGYNKNEIIRLLQNEFTNKSSHLIEEYTTEILTKIDSCNKKKGSAKNNRISENVQISSQNIYTQKTYLFGNKTVELRYGSNKILLMIHPNFKHLEVTDNSRQPDARLDLLEMSNQLVLCRNGITLNRFKENKASFFKGSVLKQLYSEMYNKKPEEWMVTVHAAGIAKADKAVLFAGNSGVGKSTITAMLKANGYKVLTDDFSAIDTKGRGYRFPAAISVKNGSIEPLSAYFPSLKRIKPDGPGHLNKSNIPVYAGKFEKGYSVNKVVFIRYDDSVPLRISPLSFEEAIPMILKESWIQPSTPNIIHFYNWLSTIQFYKLRYSNLTEAKLAIETILA